MNLDRLRKRIVRRPQADRGGLALYSEIAELVRFRIRGAGQTFRRQIVIAAGRASFESSLTDAPVWNLTPAGSTKFASTRWNPRLSVDLACLMVVVGVRQI